ncbi:hypothetical protein DEJ28_06725 [Curtobacterium sp. MCPF17_002]|uniref:hypothetical protein n=1 Tax=Curtobacterium sp. MCPF17_002 TaxID=2175645 RepID=UPI000DAA8FD7|nr:hypothetical protein [Curtobacterium sp. MCPF17_002]WIB78784.1 hypothetical protein DEJ28_06725 [Curtobacterium sp. MCPF17_002]
MISIVALARTVASDPRPAAGFLIVVVVTTLVLDIVVGGGLAFSDAEAGAALESVVQLTGLSAAVASFGASRALAVSLEPEIRRLRALGAARAPIAVFGMLAIAAAAVLALLVGFVGGDALARSWVVSLARVLDAEEPKHHGGPLLVVVGAVAIVCCAGWWSGLHASPSRGQRSGCSSRAIIAAVVVSLFLVPTVLAVALAPHLIGVVRETGEVGAADRLRVLGSADSPLIVMAAASYGFVGAAIVLAPDIARIVTGTARRTLRRGTPTVFVGLRLAEARIVQFGSLVTLCGGAVGLAVTRALTATVAESLDSSRSGAGVHELGLTIGPSLVIAAAGAICSGLAQSRGTGADLDRLERIGFSRVGVSVVLVVAAVAIGWSGTVVGIVAAGAVGVVAVLSGIDVGAFVQMDPTVPMAAAITATFGFALLFVGSEIAGSVLRRRAGARTTALDASEGSADASAARQATRTGTNRGPS